MPGGFILFAAKQVLQSLKPRSELCLQWCEVLSHVIAVAVMPAVSVTLERETFSLGSSLDHCLVECLTV